MSIPACERGEALLGAAWGLSSLVPNSSSGPLLAWGEQKGLLPGAVTIQACGGMGGLGLLNLAPCWYLRGGGEVRRAEGSLQLSCVSPAVASLTQGLS